MSDGFRIPAEEPSLLQRIGRGLQGFGAGVAGTGQQFLAGREAQEQRLSLERQRSAAEDLRRAKDLLDANDLEGIRDLAEERIGLIQQLGGDPRDTMGILNLTNAALIGDEPSLNQLRTEIDDGLRIASERGLISLPEARVQTLSQDEVVSLGFPSGSVVQRDPDGGLNVIRSPEGATPLTTAAKAGVDFRNNLISAEQLEDILLGEGSEAADRTFKQAGDLRDDFVRQSTDFIKSRDAFARVGASAEDPSAAGDLALIFNYMKVLDPASVVRESEFAQAASTGAFGERIEAAVGRVAAGTRLSGKIRADFVDRATRLFARQAELHDGLRSEFSRLATRFNLTPEDVLVDFRLATETAQQDDLETLDVTTPVDVNTASVEELNAMTGAQLRSLSDEDFETLQRRLEEEGG